MCRNGRQGDGDADNLGTPHRTPRTEKGSQVEDNTSHDDEDLHLRYSLFCELEAAIADIELEDLTREQLVALLDAFDRMAPNLDEQDRSNVVNYPNRPSLRGARDGWTMFKDRVSCERQRIGQLVDAEAVRPLPSNVTPIGERRSRNCQSSVRESP